jgi:tRNA (adenine22-N1)-methyltransferase
MKLNERLTMIAANIPNCRILTDVGTDHAYIPIYAVKNYLCEKAIAVDLREGPLNIANKNIKRRGLENSIETRQGNGLEPISLSESDVIVIAGMGGSLIRDILSAATEKVQKARLMLLQPNNAADALRKWLYESGFSIVEEKLALDAGKLYCLICAKWTGSAEKGDEFAYYIGEKLFKGNDPLLQRYLNKKLKELEVIIEGRSRAQKERNFEASGVTGMDTAVCIEIRNRLFDYIAKSKL